MTEAARPLLIFDFDGTLANTIDTGISIFNEIAPDYGLKPFTPEDVQYLRKLNIRGVLARLGINKFTAIRIANRIRKEIHDRMDEVDIFPGVADAVAKLHASGFRMGILSSNSADNIRSFMSRFNLLHCFDFIESGVSLFGKSQRINQVLKKQKVSPKEVLYIGDETRDLEATKKSDVSMIAVCWGLNVREAMITQGPAFCIETASELPECVNTFATR
jgi:phosphoglycolate phosphatase-like HAD superfamily hydrolase